MDCTVLIIVQVIKMNVGKKDDPWLNSRATQVWPGTSLSESSVCAFAMRGDFGKGSGRT